MFQLQERIEPRVLTHGCCNVEHLLFRSRWIQESYVPTEIYGWYDLQMMRR